MRLFKRACWWLWIALTLVILFLNFRLYAPSVLPRDNRELPKTILAQLKSNRSAIDRGAPDRMQSLFPEGYYFCYAMHGLTWVNVALRDETYTDQAIAEATWCLDHLESEQGKAAFPPRLPPECGMFYSTWKTHLLSGIALLEKVQNSDRIEKLRNDCDQIVDALNHSSTPFLPSYVGQAWPCDSTPGIHALKTCDHVTGEARYQTTIEKWLQKSKTIVDPETGLTPHLTHHLSGQPRQGARATSQVIILRFLADIDPEFANEQYELFQSQFYSPLLGLPGVREYPIGTQGSGDVDSGPLIFKRSLSATVFAIGTAQVFGDTEQAEAISACGEAIGFPWTWNQSKSYVGKLLPIGDVMVAYNQSALPWLVADDRPLPQPKPIPFWWRWPTHAISALVFIPFLIRLRRRKAQQSQDRAEKDTQN